jgi:hypothetical protein
MRLVVQLLRLWRLLLLLLLSDNWRHLGSQPSSVTGRYAAALIPHPAADAIGQTHAHDR